MTNTTSVSASSASVASAATSHASYLSHRVLASDVTPSSTSSSTTPTYFYPLHHLSRWSGAISSTAPVTEVKKSMAEAKAVIEVKCKRDGVVLETMYRKIGTTICVSESGFLLSLEAWSHSRPSSALTAFMRTVDQTRREVFHDVTNSHAAGPASSTSAISLKSLYQLQERYAPDSTAQSQRHGGLLSASLSAPKQQFSLAAFLDQHLQSSTTSSSKAILSRSTTAASSSSHPNSASQFQQRADLLSRTLTDLTHLQSSWRAELSSTQQSHPQLIQAEMERIELAQRELATLQQQHSQIQQHLHTHNSSTHDLHTKVQKLQSNIAFIMNVQEYEQILANCIELSEKCAKEQDMQMMSGGATPTALAASAAKASGASKDSTNNANTAVNLIGGIDSRRIKESCENFVRLLRYYQSLKESVRVINEEHERNITASSSSQPPSRWSGVPHLQSLLQTRILTLLQSMQSKLIQYYQQVLQALNWPQTTQTLLLGLQADPMGGNVDSSSNTNEHLHLFELLTENLIRIQMLLEECDLIEESRKIEREIQGKLLQTDATTKKSTSSSTTTSSSSSSSSPVQLWVLTLLLQPIYKRFYFHFDSTPPVTHEIVQPNNAPGASLSASSSTSSSSSSAQIHTNRLDKPEWICTFLEKSYVDHKDFLERIVQPIVNRCAYEKVGRTTNKRRSASSGVYEISLEFLENLLGFYAKKLSRSTTLNMLMYDPMLLRHTLTELMSFEAKLGSLYSYPISSSSRISLLDPFLNSHDVFQAIVKVEKDVVNAGLDRLRDAPHPWERLQKRKRAMLRSDGGDDDEDEGQELDAIEMIDEDSVAPDADPSSPTSISSSSSSLLHSSSSATHSSYTFLSLVDHLTSHYRSYKYLNHRLLILKDLQFKLFEIYEEDLIREYQENWKKMEENVKRGGLKLLNLVRRGGGGGEDNANGNTKAKNHTSGSSSDSSSITTAFSSLKTAVVNPIHLWHTHTGLLNSIEYIITILQEWNDEVIYVELYYYYTHKLKIQESMMKAWKESTQAAATISLNANASSAGTIIVKNATSIGGTYVKHPANAPIGGSSESSTDGIEEIYLTSEELALWMANGGRVGPATQDTNIYNNVSSTASLTNINSASSTNNTIASESKLPPEFQTAIEQLATLTSAGNTKSGGQNARAKSNVNNLFASSASMSASSPVVSPPPPSSSSLPLDLSITGTLFSPILTSYNSLREEMLHSLIHLVVNQFRVSLTRAQYMKKGHLMREEEVFSHPQLKEAFFQHEDDDLSGATDHKTARTPDWDVLEQHLDISRELIQPLIELKMQLIVVKECLTKSLHRPFWSSVASKLSQLLFDDLVVDQYFTRGGILQFMRDMRGVFQVFLIFSAAAASTGADSATKSSHFKLLHDTIHLLLLSPSQLQTLETQLTTGAVASGSSTSIRSFLSRAPYFVQRLSVAQVISIVQHIRVEQERDSSTEEDEHTRRQVSEEEAEIIEQAEQEVQQEEEEEDQDDTDENQVDVNDSNPTDEAYDDEQEQEQQYTDEDDAHHQQQQGDDNEEFGGFPDEEEQSGVEP